MKYQYSIISILALLLYIFTPLISVASADWLTFQYNPQHLGNDSSENDLKPPLTLDWTALDGANAAIVQAGNSIYGKTTSGVVFSIDMATGGINWQVQTQYSGEVAVGNGMVYAANGPVVEAYNATTGQLVWISPQIADLISGMTLANDRLYFGDYVSHAYRVLDANTGAFLGGNGLNDSSFGAPAVADGRVHVG